MANEITGYGKMSISYQGEIVYLDTREYVLKKYEQMPSVVDFDDQHDVSFLYKKGNRWVRQMKIYKIYHEDKDFERLYAKLDKMNGHVVTIVPHDDKPSVIQDAYLLAFWDRYTAYPVEFIDLILESVDIETGD